MKKIQLIICVVFLSLFSFGQNNIIFEKTTPFSTHIRWNNVDGANFYKIFRDNVYLSEITSCDTWDWIYGRSTSTYSIVPSDTTGRIYPTITGTLVTPTNQNGIYNIVGDYRNLSNLSVNGKRVTGSFTPQDKGKCISIANASQKTWYRQGRLWWHGFIAEAGNGYAILKDSVTKNGKYLGDKLSDLKNCTGQVGYVATNNANQFRILCNNNSVTHIRGVNTVYIDPFRDSAYVTNILVSQNDPALISLSKPILLIEGRFKFGEEQQIGQQLSQIGWYSGQFVDGHTHYYALKIFDHISGILGLRGTFLGPNAIPLRNQGYAYSYFYKRNISSPYNVEFHMSNSTFGDTTNYWNGFLNLASNSSGYANSGKEVVAVYNSTIACPESFEVRPWKSDSVNLNYNKRILLRKIRVIGTAFRKMGSEAVGIITNNNLLTIDSARYPGFTFNEFNLNMNYVICKPFNTPVGALNAYQYAFGRRYTPISNYTAILNGGDDSYGMSYKPLQTNKLLNIITDAYSQVGIPQIGHLQYLQAAVEVEIDGVDFMLPMSRFLRSSDAPTTKGVLRQFSVNNVKCFGNNKRFDFICKYGGYAQYSPTANCGFGCYGGAGAEAQGGANLQYGLSRNSDINWVVKHIKIYQ